MSSGSITEAVVFIDRNRVTREMLYTEFEAILDRFIPLTALSHVHAEAVYLRIDGQLRIRAAVFFKIGFDGEGFADRRWDVPLQQLAENAGKGPDLGAGPIRLACRSQCSVSWHHQNLWDPDMSPGANNFVLLKKAIRTNRLGLAVDKVNSPAPAVKAAEEPAAPKGPSQAELTAQISQQLRSEIEQEFRDHMAHLLKEQRLRIMTLDSKRKQEFQQAQLEHQQRLQDYRERCHELETQLAQQQQRNLELKETIESQAGKITGLREYFEHKVASLEQGGSAELEAMQENFTMELDARVEAATLELKEQLQLRDVELMYRREQETSWQAEIERLRQETQGLLQNSSEQLLERLGQAGMNFVAYHPGVGHLTIPLADMSSYLEDSQAYAAEKAGVTAEQYSDWLEHYQAPVCRALTDHGEVCGENIDRISTPSEFHPGENDRCSCHKTTPTQTFAVVQQM